MDRFKAFSPRRQFLLVILAALGVGGLLAAGWFVLLRTPYEPLFARMRSIDAATIIAELDRQKIPYRLADQGTTVLVPADRVDATRLAVMGEDLPLKGTVGFELFNKSDMGLTDFAQKINYQRALQGELARTIMTLDGVESVRVHLALGENRTFRDDRVPPKASVTIRMHDGAVLGQSAAQGMQRLVAAAVPQLDPANVVILDENGRAISAMTATQPVDMTASPLLQQKRAIEQYYEARVRQALEGGYPRGSVGVAVWADVVARAEDGEGPSALPGWSPAARTFRLHIVLSPTMSLPPEAQQDLRAIAADAIGFDAALSDSIGFGSAPDVQQAWQPDAVASAAARPVVDPEAESAAVADAFGGGAQIGLVAAVLLALALLYRLVRPKSRPRRMTEDQRADFATRLRTALDQGDGRAAAQR